MPIDWVFNTAGGEILSQVWFSHQSAGPDREGPQVGNDRKYTNYRPEPVNVG